MAELKDIRPIFELSDYIVPICLGFFGLLALILLVFLLFKLRKYFTKDVAKIQALAILHNLDYQQAKQTAYDFSKYAAILLNTKNELEQRRFQQLNEDLKRYKYKKDVDDLQENLVQDLKAFVATLKI